MSTTNYTDTFIQVAEDCPADSAEVPPARGAKPSVAVLQYELLAERPYEFTSDDVLFEVYARRSEIDDAGREAARAQFFAKPQACLRASPLGKRYGWGIHHDDQSRVALVPIGSDRYRELTEDDAVEQTRAMRSKRA